MKTLKKSQTEKETYESMKELNKPKEYISGFPIVVFQDDLSETEKNDPRFQAVFKRSSFCIFSIVLISQDYYELPEETYRPHYVFHIQRKR